MIITFGWAILILAYIVLMYKSEVIWERGYKKGLKDAKNKRKIEFPTSLEDMGY